VPTVRTIFLKAKPRSFQAVGLLAYGAGSFVLAELPYEFVPQHVHFLEGVIRMVQPLLAHALAQYHLQRGRAERRWPSSPGDNWILPTSPLSSIVIPKHALMLCGG